MIYSATNHCIYYYDVIFRWLMTSNFISMTLDGVTSFPRIKDLRNACKRICNSQSFGKNAFIVMAENWQHLKGTLAFSSFLCVRIEIESC